MKKILLLVLICVSAISFAQKSVSFQNPLFAGDYPDPSILVDGDTYYIVHSSFLYYPGLTIWSSKNLIDWQPVISPLKKNVGSVWAPDIVKYDSKYFIYFPAQIGDYASNYVIWSNAIDGTWSDPIDLKIGGIDPGHVVDEQGNRYLYFSNGGYTKLSKDGLSTVGDYIHTYDGWEIPREWSIECFCMEGPKLTKHGDYYYLTVAEGGTAGPATGHMVISARSKSPLGPWENSPYNPILRAQSPDEQWCSIGHATPFAGVDGKWWMVYHGYENGYYNLGRQTLLAPVEWTEDGWWKLPDNYKVENAITIPAKVKNVFRYDLSDNFESGLRPTWRFWNTFDSGRCVVKNQVLSLQAKGTDVVSSCPLLCTPQDHSYSVSVEVSFEGNAIAGLMLFYSNKIYSGVMADSTNVLSNLRGWQFPTEFNVHKGHVFLKLVNRKNVVDMFYSLDGKNWIKTSNSFDIAGYHHNVLGEFLAVRIGLVAIGENGKIHYKNFKYEALD